MNIKKFVIGFGIAMLAVVGVAIAQTTLPPNLTGSNTENRRQIFESGMHRLGQVNTTLTALAGGAQAGTVLNMGLNRFTTVATLNDSAQLPLLTGSVLIYVVNASATSMNVFPQTGQTINALSANAAFAVAAGKTVLFIQTVDGVWYSLLSA